MQFSFEATLSLLLLVFVYCDPSSAVDGSKTTSIRHEGVPGIPSLSTYFREESLRSRRGPTVTETDEKILRTGSDPTLNDYEWMKSNDYAIQESGTVRRVDAANGTDPECPDPAAIAPCICTVGTIGGVNLDCTDVESEDQLAEVFQQDFPVKELHEFTMANNAAVRNLNNILNGISFQRLYLFPGTFVLEHISDYFLISSQDILSLITIQNSALSSDYFPFAVLSELKELQVLAIEGSLFTWIPKLTNPKLTVLRLSNGLTEILETGTISVHARGMVIDLQFNQINTLEPGFFFFADDNSTASNGFLYIDCSQNKLDSLQAGTFPMRGGPFNVELQRNNIVSIEPGTFVLAETTDTLGIEETYIDVSWNNISSFEVGTFPIRSGPSTIYLNGNQLTSIVPGTFFLSNAEDAISNAKISIDFSDNPLQGLSAGTFPIRAGSLSLGFFGSQVEFIEPGTFVLPETTAPATNETFYMYVGLGGNELEVLEAGTFPLMHGVVGILLDYNQITFVQPGTFFIPDIAVHTRFEETVINLSTNKLSSIQAGTFPLRDGSSWLHLDYNLITSIQPGTFELPATAEYLEIHLYLDSNLLATFEEDVFGEVMPYIVELTLEDNPLLCGCDLAWLVAAPDFLAKVDSEAACVDGTNLHDLDPADFADC